MGSAATEWPTELAAKLLVEAAKEVEAVLQAEAKAGAEAQQQQKKTERGGEGKLKPQKLLMRQEQEKK